MEWFYFEWLLSQQGERRTVGSPCVRGQMRNLFAVRLQMIGQQLNQLRMEMLASNYAFTAGIVRGAEEVVLLVFTLLNDPTVGEVDL